MGRRNSNIHELGELGDWSRLARWPTQLPAWVRALSETVNEKDHVFAIVDGCAEALMFAARPQLGDRLYLLGAEWPNEDGEPMDALVAKNASLDGLARAMLDTGEPFSLRRLPADSRLIEALKCACRNRGIVRLTDMETAPPYVDLDESWRTPETRFNAGRRSDFRRSRRMAESFGAVTFDITVPDAANVAALTEEAFAIEAASWKAEGGSAVAQTPWFHFYSRFAVEAARDGILRICFLRIDGRAVAMQFAAEWNNAFWLFKIGYDAGFERCSPGNLLMLETLRYAAVRGLGSYEFLGTNAAWTRAWTTSIRPMVHMNVYPFTLSGLAALCRDEGPGRWERVARSVRKYPRKISKPIRRLLDRGRRQKKALPRA